MLLTSKNMITNRVLCEKFDEEKWIFLRLQWISRSKNSRLACLVFAIFPNLRFSPTILWNEQ